MAWYGFLFHQTYEELNILIKDVKIGYATKFERIGLLRQEQGHFMKGEGKAKAGAILIILHAKYISELMGINFEKRKFRARIPNGEEIEFTGKELWNILKILAKDQKKQGGWIDELNEKQKKIIKAILGIREEKSLRYVKWNDMNPIDLTEQILGREHIEKIIKIEGAGEITVRGGDTANTIKAKGFLGKTIADKVDLYTYTKKRGIELKDEKKGVKAVENSWRALAFEIKSLTARIDKLIENLEMEINREKDSNTKIKLAENIRKLKELKAKLDKAAEAFSRAVSMYSEEIDEKMKKGENPAGGGSLALGIFGSVIHGYVMMKIVVATMITGFVAGIGLITLMPNVFAEIVANRWLQILIGALLTIFFIIATNIDFQWIGGVVRKLKRIKFCMNAIDEIKSVAKEVDKIIGKIAGLTASESGEKALLLMGAFLGGMGLAWRAIGIEFYFQDEINEMIGEALMRVNTLAGNAWKAIMQYRVPFVDWTIFDVLISVVLEGPILTLSEMIMGTVITKVIAPVFDNLLTLTIFRVLSS